MRTVLCGPGRRRGAKALRGRIWILMRLQPAASRAPFGTTDPPPPPTPPLPPSPLPATSAAPQHEHLDATHEGAPEAQAHTTRTMTRGLPSSTTALISIISRRLRCSRPPGRHTAVEVGSCFVVRGSAERAFMSFCGADAEVVRCGCVDVAPAFFDALYPLRGRPVWTFCPYPRVLCSMLLTTLLRVELADVRDLPGVLILLRDGGGVALWLSRLFPRHAFPLTGVFASPPPPCALYTPCLPPSLSVARGMDVR
ncbi:hypothetical protein C8J57DRAFT_1726930 [Mycena rebaudengoi]|nr:hypothetical protein C8J57DRAFT_1726930 [Mycena rebaudengoi]